MGAKEEKEPGATGQNAAAKDTANVSPFSRALSVLNRMQGMPRGQAEKFLKNVGPEVVEQFAKCRTGDDIAKVFRDQPAAMPQEAPEAKPQQVK